MLRVVLLDRHPPLLDELRGLLDVEPDVAVTSLMTVPALRRRMPDLRPHVVVLANPRAAAVCRELTSAPDAPAVIIAAARLDAGLILTARAAGAATIVAEEYGGFGMLANVRAAATGDATLPLFGRAGYAAAIDRLADDDVPVLTMLLDGRRPAAIAAALGIAPHEVDLRVRRIVDGLQPAA